MKLKIFLLLASFFLMSINLFAIPLKGANGKTIDFAGILEATPSALVVQIKPGDKIRSISWSKFDLMDLKSNNEKIYKAYGNATGSSITVSLKLGSFEGVLTEEEMLKKLKNLLTGYEVVLKKGRKGRPDRVRRVQYGSSYLELLKAFSRVEGLTVDDRRVNYNELILHKEDFLEEFFPRMQRFIVEVKTSLSLQSGNGPINSLDVKLDSLLKTISQIGTLSVLGRMRLNAS